MSDRSALTLPFLISLLLHMAAGAIGARWSFHSDATIARSSESLAAIMPDETPPAVEPEPEPDPLRLGLNDSTATSLTWLGFDEYIEHFADQSEVDQPELTMDPPSGPPTDAMAVVLTQPAPPTPEGLESSVAEAASEPPAAQSAQAEPAEEESTDESLAEFPPPGAEESPTREEAEELDETESGTMPLAPAPAVELPPEPQPKPLSPPTPPPAPRPAPVPVQIAPTPPAPTPTPPAAPSGSGATGRQSDRESTAASILTAEWKKLGQPLAGAGLEIKTRRPKFTHYTRIMGAARDPVVLVHFRRDGRVERVDLVRSSGNADVDRPVIDAIYLWRATGEPLGRIPLPSPPATYPVEFRILM
jgi:protein TonB